ncbi:mechanosensitive ion channel family protein [Thermocoleostomius sinensis]|uniref:Mechanosensitive ion channel family protein n=1 Tax=Thermocoleostomius sinensis A174 TaxID=2016057 RepID=A0A9E8ZCR1_9CYAN|nr:mechanosensitive ion channel family protein [Thermocoleostomius sinensis]WAL59489.1 mechanosensitive ion channel family protein [Thermocoleostomius sinensis A174]
MTRLQSRRRVPFWSWQSIKRSFVILGAIVVGSILLVSAPIARGQAPESPVESSTVEVPTILEFDQLQFPEVNEFLLPVGNYINSAPVHLDGRVLFRVAPTENFTADIRAAEIEQRLSRLASDTADPEALTVDWALAGNQPVIQVNGDLLFTVTSQDAQLSGLSDPTVRAEQLSQVIEDALERYQEERQPQYLQQQLRIAGVILLIMLVLSWIFALIQRRIRRRKERATQVQPVSIEDLADTSSSQQVVTALRHKVTRQQKLGFLDFQRWLCQLGQILVWGGGSFVILGLFPYTRVLQTLALTLLKIPFRIALAVLLTYGAIRLSNVLIDRVGLTLQERATLASMQSQRLVLRFSTFSQVIKSIAAFLLISIGVLSSLSGFGIDLAPLLAGAGIVGLALSLASQNLLRDVINGFLILMEDQYGVGDVIVIGNVSGFVETMNLRITQLRNEEGGLITIPNSQITVVQNLSKEWSRVDLRIPVDPAADINYALEIIERVAQDMRDDPTWKAIILEPPLLLGVDNLDHIGATVRIWIKTQPLKQWDVAREYRRRLKLAFDKAGINIGVPQQTLHVQSALPVVTVSDDRQDRAKRDNGTSSHS